MARGNRSTRDARSIRLSFRYDYVHERFIRLYGPRQALDIVPLAPTGAARSRDVEGFWCELCAGERTLYSYAGPSPIAIDTEVFDDHGRPSRHPVESPRGAFTILVPNIPEATHVRLYGSRKGPAKPAGGLPMAGGPPVGAPPDDSDALLAEFPLDPVKHAGPPPPPPTPPLFGLDTPVTAPHPSPAATWNLVVVGEGFTGAALEEFTGTWVARLKDALRTTAPFDSLSDRIRVTPLSFPAEFPGAPVNAGCGSGAKAFNLPPFPKGRKTKLDASFCNDGLLRKMKISDRRVRRFVEVESHVHDWHAILVFVNSPIPGGRGGYGHHIAVCSTGGSAEVVIGKALHELGHAIAGLADEYAYYRSPVDDDAAHLVHTQREFVEPNVTRGVDPVRYAAMAHHVRWGPRVTAAALPTMLNPDRSGATTDTRTDQGHPHGSVGLFEGARYVAVGPFRPQHDCRMRVATAEFCGVCRQAIKDAMKEIAGLP